MHSNARKLKQESESESMHVGMTPASKPKQSQAEKLFKQACHLRKESLTFILVLLHGRKGKYQYTGCLFCV